MPQVDAPKIPGELSSEVCVLLAVDGCLHWLQNLLAFTLLKLVTPLTYAVANVTKRIAVITVSLLLLKNPVTTTNMGGMMMAILGTSSQVENPRLISEPSAKVIMSIIRKWEKLFSKAKNIFDKSISDASLLLRLGLD